MGWRRAGTQHATTNYEPGQVLAGLGTGSAPHDFGASSVVGVGQKALLGTVLGGNTIDVHRHAKDYGFSTYRRRDSMVMAMVLHDRSIKFDTCNTLAWMT
jgi:hypothetical protein